MPGALLDFLQSVCDHHFTKCHWLLVLQGTVPVTVPQKFLEFEEEITI